MSTRKIILAVTGSIAAYKAAMLTRLFVKSGHEVRILMTDAAKSFISPLTLSTLSKNEVYSDLIDGEAWNNHVELGLWADAMIVAPASANTLARMANGICDSVVTAVYLSARCPVFFAPAMDLDMWEHPSTQSNVNKLISYGNILIEPAEGELASGLHGKGRMAEPEDIFEFIENHFSKKKILKHKKLLITAGPTHEIIDPVRFIGNRSTGKMGAALALSFAERGAHVTLIMGPSTVSIQHQNIHRIDVETADEMYQAAMEYHEKCDVAVFTAAVADYKPAEQADEKIKKSDSGLELKLLKTVDIAASLGARKNNKQIHIGFALETENERQNAKAKLERKNFDMIVLNSLRDPGAGFKHDTNKISIFTSKGHSIDFDLKSKSQVAEDIVNTFIDNYVKA